MSIIKTPQKWFMIRAVKNCKIECDYYDATEQNKYPPHLEELTTVEMLDLQDCILVAINESHPDDAARYKKLLQKLNEVF